MTVPTWRCAKHILVLSAFVLASLNATDSLFAEETEKSRDSEPASDWFDPFYQYRIPLETTSDMAGWQQIPLTETQITTAVNKIEQFQFDANFFAYNAARLVEVDDAGQVVDPHAEAGFYLVQRGEELAAGVLKSGNAKVLIDVVQDEPHLLTYTSSGGGKCPALEYETIFPPGSRLRRNDYRISYFAPLLPLRRTEHDTFFVADRDKMQLTISGRWMRKLHDLSVRQVEVALLAKVDGPGVKRWMLYYQPMCSHHLQTPKLRRDEIPEVTATVVRTGVAEKFVGATQYRVVDAKPLVVSFADSTVKVVRQMNPPTQRRDCVTIRSAANERQSFQLLLTPQRGGGTLTDVEVSALIGGDHTIPSSRISARQVEYVPIRKTSYMTPAKLLGEIGDPLVPIAERKLLPNEGTSALWITIAVPPATRAGIYQGSVELRLVEQDPIRVPLSLEVYDFELPEYSSFHTNMGGQYIGKNMSGGDDARNMLDYHGLSSGGDLKKLARAYYDVMADNKFCPKTVGLFAEIDMNWSPPPKGFNVDAPGNFFELKDWDFTEFNETLRHFIDVKKVNSVCLTHTNPRVSNLFKHLPGKRRDKFARSSPHTTMAWQTFREATLVVYGKSKEDGYQDISIEVTQKQWDDLVLKYYRRIAQNLDQHGWLDKVHILIDETEYASRLHHFLKLLKSDPLTARIRTAACIQGLGLVNRHDDGHAGKVFDFRGLLDTYVPEIDENYDRWMDYYWKDHELGRDREKLWPYLVASSRLAIDTPGINNRIIGLDIFHRGGSGLLIWETIGWDHVYGDSRNPWQDPYTVHANGSLAYFYPPKGDGVASKPDFSITPSLRLETFRESVDDYEYARILEDLVTLGRDTGADVSAAEAILRDLSRFFPSNTHWSQNDAWYLELRDRMARAIVQLERGK
jgi:hypothetical protein